MIDELISQIKLKKNPTVAGLDTRFEYIPDFLLKEHAGPGSGFEGVAEAIFEFNKEIINAIYDLVPAVKVQIAYYESYGIPGMEAFKLTISHARSKGLIVIADVKRNDIGPTAEAYSSAFLGETKLPEGSARAFNADFATVNPYLGIDGVKPFIDDCKKYNKGVFILVKTSNPSSQDFQDLRTEGGRVYEIVAKRVNDWGTGLLGKYGYSSIGAVVGATYPQQLSELRTVMPHVYILIPGYGAQGAAAADIVGGFGDDGLGAIVNASRSIICAWKSDMRNSEKYAIAARTEVIRMRDEIDSALAAAKVRAW